MGNKYGSIHIKTNHFRIAMEEIAELLGDQTNEGPSIAAKIEQAIKHPLCQGMTQSEQATLLGLARAYLNESANFSNETFSIIDGEWFSLYSRELSFTTISHKALVLSQKLSSLVVYVSNFDGDVFVWGAIEGGKAVTSGQICDVPDIYGLVTETADMASLSCALGEDCEIPAEMPTDVYEMEDVLSRAMGVPVNIFEEFVYSDPEHYEKVEERYGVRVYRKL